jgi:ATP-dependent RNA helicase DeaD
MSGAIGYNSCPQPSVSRPGPSAPAASHSSGALVNASPAAVPTAASESSSPSPGFRDLNLDAAVLLALADLGYEVPTPIQAATIPPLLSGSDLLGQAQTGTGKTAAFALPVLSKIDLSRAQPQALVLVPTRELAIQVAEAFQSYAAHLKGFHVLPIYGGQSYTPQIRGLKRGAHVIVGTPGRVMDHMKRGTLDLTGLSFLVLDEADEMLQMGFVDDIEWILEQVPPQRQVALFSATLAPAIRRIAQKHLRTPVEITIQSKTSTAANIRQRYWLVSGLHKLDALTRILEAETFDGMLIFVRTKLETVDLSERLQARGFDAVALNGDIPQQQRERTVNALKEGKVDIVVATDVAARGLDVERISHVVNYDVPYDSETYIHRIGRTGRAGRKGEAILFIAPRERNMLRIIERATRQTLEQMRLPSIADVNEQRVARFKQRITEAVASGEGAAFRELMEEFEREQNVPAIEVAAALASLLQGGTPLLLPEKAEGWGREGADDGSRRERRGGRQEERGGRDGDRGGRRGERFEARDARGGRHADRERGAQRYDGRGERVEGRGAPVGRRDERGEHHGASSEQRASPERQSEERRRDESHSGPEAERRSGQHADREPDGRRHDEPGASRGAPDPGHEGQEQRADGERAGSDMEHRGQRDGRNAHSTHGQRHDERGERGDRGDQSGAAPKKKRGSNSIAFETYRIEVGHVHGVKPGNIVGAIANEAGLEGRHIGNVDIREDHSFVDLPEGMPKEIFRALKKVRVVGRELQIAFANPKGDRAHKRD